MTEEMYKRLNDYLNDIFLKLNKTDKIFTDNLINFTIINNMVANKLGSKKIIVSQKENNLSFENIIELTCEILQKINSSYVEIFKKIVMNGELNFSYESEYDDSHCSVKIHDSKILKQEVNINRGFNYSDVTILIHEFIHYTNNDEIFSDVHSFLREFISIYFELFAVRYLVNNKNIDTEEININSRIVSFLRNNDKFYNYIYILLAYENLGNINSKTINDIKNILQFEDDCFEKECISFLENLDRINNKFSKPLAIQKMTEMVTKDYRYIVGTLLAYYAIENCTLEDMVNLNQKFITGEYKNFDIDELLNDVGIDMNDNIVNKSIDIIDNSIHEYEREKIKWL